MNASHAELEDAYFNGVERTMEQVHEARSLIERLVGEDPITYSTEGLDDGCFWCGAYDSKPVEHQFTCTWIEGMNYLGREIDQAKHIVGNEHHIRARDIRVGDKIFGRRVVGVSCEADTIFTTVTGGPHGTRVQSCPADYWTTVVREHP